MKPNLTKPGTATRKPIMLAPEGLVHESLPNGEGVLPLLLEPAVEGLSLSSWTTSNRESIQAKLTRHGALLFRGFSAGAVADFEEFMTILAGNLLDYSYRSTPRTQVSGKIFTSTEYPAHQTIPLHNEMSYSRHWPMMLGFFCLQPAAEGGETPIADSRKVLARIEPAIRDRFKEKNVRYVRNYGDALDLPWQEVFQTDDRAAVEDFCREAQIEFAWQADGRLRTSQVCQAIARHPRTEEDVWFNQAHLFHVSSLNAEVRNSLFASAGDEPPRNAYYGDGSPLDDRELDSIRAAYASETIIFKWQQGDVLVIDTMIVAHGG